MSASERPVQTPPRPASLSWAELGFIFILLAGGFLFLRDAPYWGRSAYVGSAQFGDAEFWWNGALHFSQGIVAENPNLTFRMGYAAFAGTIAAVCGPDYRIFHQILLVIFLVTLAACYLSLRQTIGRIAAAVFVLCVAFNPFTAEWLAISTSDALGLILNAVAILALVEGVRQGLRLRPLALFGIFLACASLTRPLMTPFFAPAALAVIAVGWRAWRRTALALGVMFAAFVLPTLAWMAFMGATTGNFALTGASQDSSAFYAASDPQIQVWRPDMYAAVRDSAQKRYHVERPSAKQLNAEFWVMTRENYVKHWRFHARRAWLNLVELARFTPARAGTVTPESEKWRTLLKGLLTVGLGALALRQRRQWPAILVFVLGALWTFDAAAVPWLVLLGGTAALATLFFHRPVPFVWATYWWVGVAALYLTGGTWGPPLGQAQELNALGYRLGFQFFFANDLLVIGLLGVVGLGGLSSDPDTESAHPLLRSSPWAARGARAGLWLFFGLLAGLLGTGAVVVGKRIVSRAHATPVAYPDLAAVTRLPVASGATAFAEFSALRGALAQNDGRPVLTRAMSSGFIWNLPGQQRSMLLLYQQDNVTPVTMSPRQIYVEVSRHLPDRKWMNRQGAWILRSFANTAQVSNLPYYFEMPAIRAFVPLGPDGKSYEVDRAVVFPLAKTATQLVAGGELVITGADPEWSLSSGTLRYPRRFALRAAADRPPVGWTADLSHARGSRSLRFAVQLESANPSANPRLRLETNTGAVLWSATLAPGAEPVAVEPVLAAETTGLRLAAENLQPGDTLWFYELVLEANDFAQ